MQTERFDLIKSVFFRFNKRPMDDVVSETMESTLNMDEREFVEAISTVKKLNDWPANLANAIWQAKKGAKVEEIEDPNYSEQASDQNRRYFQLVQTTLVALSSTTTPTFRDFWEPIERDWNQLANSDGSDDQFETVISNAESQLFEIRRPY